MGNETSLNMRRGVMTSSDFVFVRTADAGERRKRKLIDVTQVSFKHGRA